MAVHLHAHLGAEMAQHVLAVIARRLALHHAGQARRIEAAEQQRGFHLSRGHRHLVLERHCIHRPFDRERQSPALARREPRPAGRQRLSDAAHRPAAQARVTGHHREERVARHDSGEQPCRGAGIAHIQHIRGLHQATDAAPGDAPFGPILHHLGAKRAHGGGGAQHVLPGQQTGDAGLADGQRAEHQGAMADGFVARHGDAAGERSGRAVGGQRPDGGSMHEICVSIVRNNLTVTPEAGMRRGLGRETRPPFPI